MEKTAKQVKQRVRIGQQLLAAGIITQAQLEAALEQQQHSRGFLGDVLVKMGFVKVELVGQMLAATMNVPYFNPTATALDPEAYTRVPEDFQRQHHLIPCRLEGRKLFVVMSDPLNVPVIESLELITGLRVEPLLALESEITDAFNRIYTVQHAAESVLREIENETTHDEPDLSADQLANLADDAPIIRLVNSIIAGAIGNQASDIHIEPMEKSIRVRYRIDGLLYEQMLYAPQHHPAVVSRIKIMAHMNIAERRRSQDGRIGFHSDGLNFDLRISTMQMLYGEKIVMRLLNKSGITVPLEKLGFFPEQQALWNSFLAQPHGIILVTGPTGSGKSTTLYASLNKINDKSRNIITVEDPIEYHLKGINQAQVNSKIGMTFAAGLRTIVRQDPDVIMVGEVRDAETAEIAVQAALTGHLVMTTLHTNDAPGALVRLENMGVERFLITSSVVGVIAQRLLRRVCEGCAEPETPNPDFVQLVGLTPMQVKAGNFRHGKGCSHCGGRGYRGRTAVYEVLPMSNRLREGVRQGHDGALLKQAALDDGMVTLRESGIRRVLSGETTLEEVSRVLLGEEIGKAVYSEDKEQKKAA